MGQHWNPPYPCQGGAGSSPSVSTGHTHVDHLIPSQASGLFSLNFPISHCLVYYTSSGCHTSRRKVSIPYMSGRPRTNHVRQARLARPRISSPVHRLSANFRFPFQISDGCASTRAFTPANLATRRKHPKLPLLRRPSTTPRTSSISFMIPSSISSETTRPLRKRSPDLWEEVKPEMQLG